MIEQIFAIAKAQFHFKVTCKLQEREARKRLEAYAATLSPEKREWANTLRERLNQASPDEAAAIFRRESARLNEAHMRVAGKSMLRKNALRIPAPLQIDSVQPEEIVLQLL